MTMIGVILTIDCFLLHMTLKPTNERAVNNVYYQYWLLDVSVNNISVNVDISTLW